MQSGLLGQVDRMNPIEPLVCVVDDDQSVRRGLQWLFRSINYTAEVFASSEDYLARKASPGPICLVVDLLMPGINGLDLQRMLEERGGGEQVLRLLPQPFHHRTKRADVGRRRIAG